MIVSKEELLLKVRSIQQYLAIGSEILILVAFAMSGMDTSVGGAMADISYLKWFWAAVFALGVDSAFVISWVRCRQCVTQGKKRHLWWNIPVALGMSFVVWQPVMIQLLQQALNISFNQALNDLGVSIVTLVIARSIVAVVLGGILALTNVESDTPPVTTEQPVPVTQPGVQVTEEQPEQPSQPVEPAQIEQPKEQQPARFHVVRTVTDPVTKTLLEHPEMTIRQVAQKHNCSPPLYRIGVTS